MLGMNRMRRAAWLLMWTGIAGSFTVYSGVGAGIAAIHRARVQRRLRRPKHLADRLDQAYRATGNGSGGPSSCTLRVVHMNPPPPSRFQQGRPSGPISTDR